MTEPNSDIKIKQQKNGKVVITLPDYKSWVALAACFEVGYDGMSAFEPEFQDAKAFYNAMWRFGV